MYTFCGSLIIMTKESCADTDGMRILSKDFLKKEHNPSKYLDVLCYDFPRNSIPMRKGELPYDRDRS